MFQMERRRGGRMFRLLRLSEPNVMLLEFLFFFFFKKKKKNPFCVLAHLFGSQKKGERRPRRIYMTRFRLEFRCADKEAVDSLLSGLQLHRPASG